MAVQVQFRRGNTSQHSTFTGAEGEITVNTEKDILVIHDGSTVGGFEVARVNNPYFNGNADFSNATFSSNLIPSSNVTYSIGSPTKRWANLYLSGNTIVIGNQAISSNATTLVLGNTSFSGEIDLSVVTFSGNLIPNSNGDHGLGNGTFRWKKLYLANNGITMGVHDHTITTNSTTFILTQNVTTNDSFMVVQGNTIGPVVNTSGFHGNVTANSLNVGGDVTITGNLVVTGTTLYVNTTTLDVKDSNITVAKGAANASVADGAGITIDGANATILYTSATNTFNFSNYVTIGNSSVNTTINATSFTGDAATVGGNSAANLNLYASDKAANAYANAVSYTDSRIIDSVTNTSTSYAASANSVKNAYDRAINANTRAASAQTEAAAAYSGAVSYTDSRIIDSVTNTSIVYAAALNSVKNAYDRAIDANTRAASAQTEAASAYTNAASYADAKAANAYSNATSYADAKAANAYSNAVAYTNSIILDSVVNTSITYVATANSAKHAYDRAIDANTRAASAQTEASAAYTNAASYADAKAANAYSNATSYADAKAANAYSNATSYTDAHIIDSVTNTSIAYAASANSVKNAYDRAIDANTRAYSAQTEASAAYTNAAIFASNASNINTGTLAEARLPYRMDQNVRTTDNIQFNNLTLSGNLVVNGGVVTVTGNSASFSDNMLYINQGISANITNIVGNGSVVTVTANNNYQVGWDVTITGVNPSAYNALHNNIIAANSTSFSFTSVLTDTYVSGGISRGKTEANPDLGFVSGYNDGSYHHTGLFRDASDGIWKVFDNYAPEPDASIYIDTSNNTFHIANFQANTLYLGNTSTNWLVSNTSGVYHTGTMNAASFTVDATFIANSSGVYSIGGTNIINVGNSSVNATINATSFTGTSNNTLYVGSVTAVNVVSNAQLSANLSNYQTTAGLTANIAAYLPTYTGIVNSSSFTVGSNFIANSTGAYHTGTVNAASFTVGTTVVSNSTGVFVGANVSSTVTTITVGNSTVNTAVTAGVIGRTDVVDTFVSNTTATVSQTAIDSFSATTYRSAKYIVQATNGSSYHYAEVAVIHDGVTAYATEFATMFTGSSLVSFAVDISGGNVRLLATAANATTTTYKIDRKLIKV